MSIRLFIAVDLPPKVKVCAGELMRGLPHVKWVAPANLHLTLRFIGDVEPHTIAPLDAALQTVRGEAFRLRLAGVGQFPRNKAARVMWVAVETSPELTALARTVESAVVKAGFGATDKPFAPHVTLGRINRQKHKPPADVVDAYLAHHADFVSEPFTVDRFILYRSTLSPQGSTYTHEAVYPLLTVSPTR